MGNPMIDVRFWTTGCHAEKTARLSRRARIAVEPLEGRRLLDAGGSSGLVAAAQAQVSMAASAHVQFETSFDQERAQLAAQAQNSLTALRSAEQHLRVLISQETRWVHGRAHGSLQASARVLAQANEDFARVRLAEATVSRSSASVQARFERQAKVSLGLSAQAMAQSHQELEAAVQGSAQTAQALGLRVSQALAAARQSEQSAQTRAVVAVRGVEQTAQSLCLQANQALAAAQQVQLGASVGVGLSATARTQGGISG